MFAQIEVELLGLDLFIHHMLVALLARVHVAEAPALVRLHLATISTGALSLENSTEAMETLGRLVEGVLGSL